MTGGVLLEMFLGSIYLSKTRPEAERRDDVPFMAPPGDPAAPGGASHSPRLSPKGGDSL